MGMRWRRYRSRKHDDDGIPILQLAVEIVHVLFDVLAALFAGLYRLWRPRPQVVPSPTLSEGSKPLPSELPYRSRESLLSRGEHALYDVLVDVAAPGQIVLAKVRLADVVAVTARRSERMSWLARVIQKHVDFVVCEAKTLRILLVIELDDRTHDDPDRQERDSFVDDVLAAAGIPIHHVRARQAYDVEELRRLLARYACSPAYE